MAQDERDLARDYLDLASTGGGRKYQATNERDAVREYLGQTLPETPAAPAAPSWLSSLRVPKLVTEGLPAAGRAAAEAFRQPGPEYARIRRAFTGEPILGDAREGPSVRGVSEALSPPSVGRFLLEALGRPFQALGAGAAELGPEQAKPLTEALVSQAPFLPWRGLRPRFGRRPAPTPVAPPEIARPQLALPPRRIPLGERAVRFGEGPRALPAPGPEAAEFTVTGEGYAPPPAVPRRALPGRVQPALEGEVLQPTRAFQPPRLGERPGRALPGGVELPGGELTVGRQAEPPSLAPRARIQFRPGESALTAPERPQVLEGGEALPVHLQDTLGRMYTALGDVQAGRRIRIQGRHPTKGRTEEWISQPSTFPAWIIGPRTQQGAQKMREAVDNIIQGRPLGSYERRILRDVEADPQRFGGQSAEAFGKQYEATGRSETPAADPSWPAEDQQAFNDAIGFFEERKREGGGAPSDVAFGMVPPIPVPGPPEDEQRPWVRALYRAAQVMGIAAPLVGMAAARFGRGRAGGARPPSNDTIVEQAKVGDHVRVGETTYTRTEGGPGAEWQVGDRQIGMSTVRNLAASQARLGRGVSHMPAGVAESLKERFAPSGEVMTAPPAARPQELPAGPEVRARGTTTEPPTTGAPPREAEGGPPSPPGAEATAEPGTAPPRFERTAIGDQALIPGAERQIPPTRLQSPRPQAKDLGPLFENLPSPVADQPDLFVDESGALNLGKMTDAWKRAKQAFPMEGQVRQAVPNSPVISSVERHSTYLSDWMKKFTDTPVYRALQKMKPAELMDLEERMVSQYETGLTSRLGAGPTPPGPYLQVPAEVQGYLRFRDRRLQQVEQAARRYFGLDPIPETPGPYLPRRTVAQTRESVSLGGGRLGLGRDIQTTVRGHQQERVFETGRRGEQRAGIQYEDPRNSILLREWEGAKLDATHRLFRELEAKGVLHRDRASAARANAALPKRSGGPWHVENAPGGEWWARSEEEAKFLQQNLMEPTRGTNLMSSFVHYANALIRTPGLFNPLPHLTKNMGYKYLLQRGPMGVVELAPKVVEYARGTNPTRLAEFREAMPFSGSGRTAADVLHTELREGSVRDAIKKIERAATFASRKLSQPAVFQYGDPALRYALFDYYRRQGMGVYEAGNHAWQDLVRYGTRSLVTDEWKSIPMNFFVPWRYGTVVSLLKAVRNHPVRTALLVGGIEYLREARYRQSGRWTHLPIDYVEKPIAQVAQERNPADLPALIATMGIFGPGGDFSWRQIKDLGSSLFESGAGRGIQDPDELRRIRNMFWFISQAYEIPTEVRKGFQSGDATHFGNALAALVAAEHSALSAEPRRLMRGVPEWLPGMTRAPKVVEAERRQQAKREMAQRRQQHRRPRRTIEEMVEEAGYR